MVDSFFSAIEPIRYGGPDAESALAFRFYDKDRVVRGKRMEDHLRMAVCFWHTFAWDGTDMFGSGTFQRPWQAAGDALARAKLKAAVAFDFFSRLGVSFFCFHDRDVSPEGHTLAESNKMLDAMADVLAEHMQRTGVKLLWEPPTCSLTRATWRARPPTLIPRSLPTPQPR